METPKILGNLMRSPAPPDGAQAGAIVASTLSKPAGNAATPASPAAPAVAAALLTPIATQAAPQAVLVPVTPDSPVATFVGAAFKAPEPTPQPSAAAALVVTVISRDRASRIDRHACCHVDCDARAHVYARANRDAGAARSYARTADAGTAHRDVDASPADRNAATGDTHAGATATAPTA